MYRSSARPGRRRRGLVVLVVACTSLLATDAAAQTREGSFLGLTAGSAAVPDFWEGRTNYRLLLRPKGVIRAVMLFARFPDAEADESTRDLDNRLVPEAVAYFNRVSYGEMTLAVDVRHRWIAMDKASTSGEYDTSKWGPHKAYIAEVVRKAGKDVDFRKYDIVYIVGSKNRGTPKSPTWLARPGDGIRAGTAEIRHAVTFGNDCRNPNWGWQTLAHETGHVFGLPDLYNHKLDTPRSQDHQRHVGCWDPMGCQQTGSEYLAWHKYKLGWLSDQNVLIARKTSRTGLVTPIDEKGGIKAVVVPINDVEAYVVEVRSRDAKPGTETGVLCYKVSLSVANGQGPIQVIPSRPDDDNRELKRKFITLYNALYFKGPVIVDADRRIKIEILGREGRAYRIGVTR
jgi:M6 family metalloprotease-like protein